MATAPPIAFSHVGIHCFDLEKMVDFYTRIMGLTLTDHGEIERGGAVAVPVNLAFLSSDPRDHHQLVLVGKPEREVERGALLINQISFRLDSLDRLRKLRRTLEHEGVTTFRTVSHGNAWSIHFPDPEGNTVEAFVDSPWYVSQPAAEPLDLDRSDEEIRRATEERFGNEPSFRPVEEWRSEVAQKMGVRNS